MDITSRASWEPKYEIITSESSYLKSLKFLSTHFLNHPSFKNVVSSCDRKSLFAYIAPVQECSEKFLTELESCWQDNIMLIGLSKRIYTIAEKYFHVYVEFCEHQGHMIRTLKHLRESNDLFAQNLELLESSPACCGQNLYLFLMLPKLRITKLPRLIDAVFSKCHPNDDEYENWKMCLAIMNKIVTQCNEAANKSEQAFEIEKISRQLEFNPLVIRPLAIAPADVLAPGSKPRYLVKKGELTHLIWRGDNAKLSFGKKFSKTTIYAFLFSDLLVLTKRKAEEQYSVFDYCPRNMLTITSGDSLPQLPSKGLNSKTGKNLMLITLLENHERKTVVLLFSCPSVSEQERWLEVMRPPESPETPGEKLYEEGDCPQVVAKHACDMRPLRSETPDDQLDEEGDCPQVVAKHACDMRPLKSETPDEQLDEEGDFPQVIAKSACDMSPPKSETPDEKLNEEGDCPQVVAKHACDMRPLKSETPDEQLDEEGDCPQVVAKQAYENNEPNFLNFDVGDVINVTSKLADGWCMGERIRDGAVGRFPVSYTEKLISVHARARNFK